MGTPGFLYPFRALLFVLLLSLTAASAQTVTTQATTVPLLLPGALAYDAQGNLYFAETANHVIRRIDPTGGLTTFAGTGTQGFAGDSGLATAALLDSPGGLAVAASGAVFVADTHNQRIRRVDPVTGTITTIAGTGAAGFAGDEALATSATLCLPGAMALDAAGDLYFADAGNHRIRRIDAVSGIITTVAGDGTQGFAGDSGLATAASIDTPSGIAISAAGDVYLADTHNQRIRRIDHGTGDIATIAGTGVAAFGGDSGGAVLAAVALPHGLTADAAGNLYLSDFGNQRIRRIDAVTGVMTTVAGEGTQTFAGDGSPAVAASLDTPRAVTISTAGLVTLADTGNARIRQIEAAGIVDTVGGLGTTAPGVLTLTGPAVTAYGTGSVTALLTSSAATGAVTFFDNLSANPVTLGSVALSNNVAGFSIAQLSAGQHALSATYAGDTLHAAAQSSLLAVNITQATTVATLTTTLSATASGTPVTLSVYVASTSAGIPTGTVTLLDGGQAVASGTLSATGYANLSLTSLSLGTHTLTASYAGDSNFLACSSNIVVVAVSAGASSDFTLAAASSTTVTIGSGNAGSFSFAVATTGPALASPITLTASGLPAGATASFSPAYLPPGSTPANFTLTIQTPIAAVSRKLPYAFALLLPLLLWKRSRRRAVGAMACIACVFSFSGCGARVFSAAQSSSIIPYEITVTATATRSSGAVIQHTAVVTLNMQP